MTTAITLPYQIHRLQLGPAQNLIYLLHDLESGRGAVVDPAWEPARIIDLAESHGIQITDVLLTHSHYDHINGIEQILEVAPNAHVHLLKQEADFWSHSLTRPTLHHGGEVLSLGKTEISILHTPGHTPGSACYHLADGGDLITGDTLFVFGCGRCDMSGGDPEQMFHSLRRLRDDLPIHTCIHPGHQYAEKTTSTLAEQTEGNPFLHFSELKDFVHYRMHHHDRVRDTPYAPISAESLRTSLGTHQG